MRQSTRILLAVTMTAGLVAAAFPQPSSAFDTAEQKCRAAIAKGGGKYAKTVLKAMSNCHKTRDKDGPNATDCNDIATADVKMKVPVAETKFDTGVVGKCTTGTPGDVLYDVCPAPCGSINIVTFSDLVDCEICLTRANAEAMSGEANGLPTAPISDELEADCHKAVVKNASKLYNGVIKTVAKCQAKIEKDGVTETVAGCTQTDFATLTDEAHQKAFDAVLAACDPVTLPSGTLDACGGAASGFDLALCVADTARDAAQEIVTQHLDLNVVGPTTTTSSTTTTTIGGGGGSHPQCPNLGELVLYSKLTNEVCANNGDCTAPRTCDPTLLRCTTVADLDSGWTGAGHDSDINDGVTARAALECPGPPSPGCGECTVLGIDPGPGNCRCANNILNVCDQPFVADANDCGGAVCNCYFGAPFPLAAGGTPVCVSNRFAADISGTANPDLGSGTITASLRAQVFNGLTTDMPCPVCGGKCSNDNSGCIFDADCDLGATCMQDTPSDGIRGGLCVRDPNFHTDDGTACDSDGTNASFPARIGNTTPGEGGAGYSIDCQPLLGANISGQGLNIILEQTTGVSSLSAGLDCDAGGTGTDLCPCMVCSGDQSFPCDSNADCGALAGSCAGAPNGGGVSCSSNTDCTAANVGPCQGGIFKCAKKQTLSCASNADCLAQDVSPCNSQTCTANGLGENPKPNDCTDGNCTDQGGGEGICLAGPAQGYCDALVKADGSGINSCTQNADCSGGYGACTLSDQADCFLDPIVATGAADPDFPVAGAVFCVPPTSNGAVNDVAGLPGPGRVISQSAARTFCTSNNAVEYTPGGTPACP